MDNKRVLTWGAVTAGIMINFSVVLTVLSYAVLWFVFTMCGGC